MKKEHDFSKAKRGSVVSVPRGKTRITIRIDTDVLDWFREQVHGAGGGSYQAMMNSALREFAKGHGRGLEELVRDVVRQELARSRSGSVSKRAA